MLIFVAYRILVLPPTYYEWYYPPFTALANVIVAFSEMAIELGDVVDAVEANPVIASPGGVIAVDALGQASRAES
jgi:hypothetical protein